MQRDQGYLQLFLDPIMACKTYLPKFGVGNKKEGISLPEFKDLYGKDPFYAWIGLDSDFMYAAHKAAGGMTSIYRQIGIGCERLFRAIILDQTGYSDKKFVTWS